MHSGGEIFKRYRKSCAMAINVKMYINVKTTLDQSNRQAEYRDNLMEIFLYKSITPVVIDKGIPESRTKKQGEVVNWSGPEPFKNLVL